MRRFTRTDLVVGVVCVAVVFANLGAIGRTGRERAKQAVCMSNLRQWGKAFLNYADDHDGRFNPGVTGNGEDIFAGGHDWPDEVSKYYDDPKLLFCPNATKPLGTVHQLKYSAWVWMDSLNPDLGEIPKGSYGLNSYIPDKPYEGEPGTRWDYPRLCWRTPNVRGANYIPLMADCFWPGGFPQHYDDPPQYENDVGWTHETRRWCIDRHGNGTINGVFLDGTVRTVGLKELWELHWSRYWNEDNDPPPVWPPWMMKFKDYWHSY